MFCEWIVCEMDVNGELNWKCNWIVRQIDFLLHPFVFSSFYPFPGKRKFDICSAADGNRVSQDERKTKTRLWKDYNHSICNEQIRCDEKDFIFFDVKENNFKTEMLKGPRLLTIQLNSHPRITQSFVNTK